MKKLIFGNWKMNLGQNAARNLTGQLCELALPAQARVAVFPPFTALAAVQAALKASGIALGGQDCSIFGKEGAYTGEISAAMLRDAGCTHVLAGHSERRSYFSESDETIRRKAASAMEAGLVPVICVGETEAERNAGRYLEIIASQVRGSVPSLTHSEAMIIAYEPVWAIGSGAIPSIKQISQVHKSIASLLTYGTSGARTAILYGGSVKSANAADILSCDGVDGVLVGGASLKAAEFGAIIAAAGKANG